MLCVIIDVMCCVTCYVMDVMWAMIDVNVLIYYLEIMFLQVLTKSRHCVLLVMFLM